MFCFVGFQLEEHDLHNLRLLEVQELLNSNGRALTDYSSFPQPDLSNSFKFHKFIIDEINHHKEQMEKLHQSLLQSVTNEQLHVYNKIMATVNSEVGNFFFLYGYGGTGKTYLWKLLSGAIRAKGMIALNVASSGIASLLLPEGKIAHSTFCIPLAINDESLCNINQGSLLAKLLMETKLIIWDEAPIDEGLSCSFLRLLNMV